MQDWVAILDDPQYRELGCALFSGTEAADANESPLYRGAIGDFAVLFVSEKIIP